MHPNYWPAYRQFLLKSKRPILVGPWHSEIGFEALYWLPWLHAQGFPADRLIPITRGGAGVWYGSPTSVELFALRDPADVRIENRVQQGRSGLLKQIQMTAFDRAVYRDAAKDLGIGRRYHVLHPHWMYNGLAPYWNGSKGLEWLWQRLTKAETVNGKKARTLPIPPAPPWPADVVLPKQFVTARFYLRSTFPNCEAAVVTARECVKKIAATMPVILLNSGVHADEHVDLELSGPNIIKMTDLTTVTPQNNLLLQSALLARAQGFVGTYGGMAQLALRFRKPTVSFYVDWQGTAIAHKFLADAMAMQLGVAAMVLRVGDIPLLHATLPQITFQAPSSGGSQVQGPLTVAPESATV